MTPGNSQRPLATLEDSWQLSATQPLLTTGDSRHLNGFRKLATILGDSQLLLATLNYSWQLLAALTTSSDNWRLWRLSAIPGDSQRLLATFSNTRRLSATLGDSRRLLATLSDSWIWGSQGRFCLRGFVVRPFSSESTFLEEFSRSVKQAVSILNLGFPGSVWPQRVRISALRL